MAIRSKKETRFDQFKNKFLNHKIGVITVVILLLISALAAFIMDIITIGGAFRSNYELTISGTAPKQFMEYKEEKVEFEIMLSGKSKKIVDNATISFQILDENGKALDSASTLRAFILPEGPVLVPPLSPEVTKRIVSITISTQKPGNYIMAAKVTDGSRKSNTQVKIRVNSLYFENLKEMAPKDYPLLVVSDGTAKSLTPITELSKFMILLPDHLRELGYFNSTLFISPTYLGSAGGMTWQVTQNKSVGDISTEYYKFANFLESPYKDDQNFDVTATFDHGETLVLVGDTWYEVTIIDAQRIIFRKRNENCRPISGTRIGETLFKNPEAYPLNGEKWVFKEVGLEVIQGVWDYGATGRIGTAYIEINGKLFQQMENINEAGFKFYDGFPMRFELADGRKVKLYANPLSVYVCDPVFID